MVPIPGVDAAREQSLADLRRVVEVEDPAYKPAQFLLATTLLDVGDAEAAAPLFAELMRPVDERAAAIFSEVQEQWKSGAPRHTWLSQRWPVKEWIRPWLDTYHRILSAVNGGRAYLFAKWWSDLRKLLDTPAEPSVIMDLDDAKRFRADMIELNVGLFRSAPDLQKYVELAAGMKAGSLSTGEARDFLDLVLDEGEIWDFAHTLGRLSFQVQMKSFDRVMRRSAASGVDEIEAQLAKLRKSPVARLYAPGLDRLEAAVKEKRWKDVEAIADELTLETQEPSEYAAAQLLQQAMVPAREAPFVNLFLPAFGFLDKWRRTFGNTLYLESAYGRYLADYLRGDEKSLAAALQGATQLAERLGQSRHIWQDPDRAEEFPTLVSCLASDAAVRHVMSPASGEISQDLAQHRFEEELPQRARWFEQRWKEGRSAEERAAAARSLGLIARFVASSGSRAASVDLKLDDTGYFEHSREAADTAETNFCLAESFVARNDSASAARFLSRALAIAPKHARARKLAAVLASESGEQ